MAVKVELPPTTHQRSLHNPVSLIPLKNSSKRSLGRMVHYSTFPFQRNPKDHRILFFKNRIFFISSANYQRRNNHEGTEELFLIKRNFVITEFIKSGTHCVYLQRNDHVTSSLLCNELRTLHYRPRDPSITCKAFLMFKTETGFMFLN